MTNILFVTPDNYFKSILESAFDEFNDVRIMHVGSVEQAMILNTKRNFDLVIADEKLADMSGVSFIRLLICKNPMANCAVVSSQESSAFHKESEGLGILMQIPNRPRKKDAEKLLERVAEINRISEL